jgi:hypothetical protein
MAINEKVRRYQTTGDNITGKKDSPHPKGTIPPTSVAVQFNDVTKKELGLSCEGSNYK